MKITQNFSQTILKRSPIIMTMVSILSIFGTMIVLSGGVWDATSHILKEPELFWTIQHMVVYTGVAMITFASMISYIVLRSSIIPKFSLGIKILIIGTILQLVAGFGDSFSHDIFGIDGLLSLSHQPLELGLLLVSIGGFLILKNIKNRNTKKLLPFSIISILVAASWLGFNLILLIGGTLMCIPIYEVFSSGCAIL